MTGRFRSELDEISQRYNDEFVFIGFEKKMFFNSITNIFHFIINVFFRKNDELRERK